VGEVLGIDHIAADADFLRDRRDSLSAVQLMGRIRDVYQIALSIGALFDYPTLGQFVGALRERGAS
jgi:acyl carrier protein